MRRSSKALGISLLGSMGLLLCAAEAVAQQPKQPLRKCSCTCYFFHMGQKMAGTLDDFSAASCNVLSVGQVSGAPQNFCKSGDYVVSTYTVDSCKDLGSAPATVSLPPANLPPTGTLPTLQPAKPATPGAKLPATAVPQGPAARP